MSDGSSTCAVHVEVRAGTGDGQNCRGERPRRVKDGQTRSDDHRDPSPRSVGDYPERTCGLGARTYPG